jgi:hypothetical protein
MTALVWTAYIIAVLLVLCLAWDVIATIRGRP